MKTCKYVHYQIDLRDKELVMSKVRGEEVGRNRRGGRGGSGGSEVKAGEAGQGGGWRSEGGWREGGRREE
jgi:hypothetical protein